MSQINCYRISIILFLLYMSACSTSARYRILNAPVVSMTHSKIPPNYRLKVGKSFFFKFCEKEKPIKDTGNYIGLADQVLYKAQKTTKSTHLIDVLVTREDSCVIAEGNTAKAIKVQDELPLPRKTASENNQVLVEEILPPDPDEQDIFN